MPASAGRVRMPHNNRMSTSASLKSTAIWQKTIGHDPYAGKEENNPTDAEVQAGKEKAAQVMAAARQQNLTDGASRDDFAQKMYQGLKSGKRSRMDVALNNNKGSELKELLNQETSSSEDEFVEVDKPRETQSGKRKKKRSKRKKRRRASSDEDSSSSDDEHRRRRERRKRKESRKKKHKRERSRRDSSSDSSVTSEERSYRRKKREKKDKKRSSSKRESRASFIACEAYDGSKKGYVFRRGEKGVGYYVDNKPRIDKKERDEAIKVFRD